MAFATPQDMVLRKDPRILGSLCGDGQRVPVAELTTHPVMLAALDDATAEMMAALFRGNRYTQDDIDNRLSAAGKKHLTHLCCVIAYAHLWDRKPVTDDNSAKQFGDALEKSREAIDALRKGTHILDIEENKDAGIPKTDPIGPAAIRREFNLLRDRLGNLPDRRAPDHLS